MQTDLLKRIQDVLQLPPGKGAHLHEPSFDDSEKNTLMRCVDSGFVSSVGKFVDQFEDDLAKYLGAKKVIACMNGTAALQLCLVAAGVKTSDEVILPALTFIATANACHYLGASPHFVNVNPYSLSICPLELEKHLRETTETKNGQCFNKKTKNRISALIVMHCFGHVAEISRLQKICSEFNIELIEDAAESLGSTLNDQQSGTLSKLAAISFNGNKIITTGGGGAVVTSDKKLGDKIKHLSTTAKIPHPYEFHHDEIGYNFRLPNINAALGVAQLKKLDSYLKQKRLLAKAYEDSFQNCSYADFGTEPENCKSNYWLNYIRFKEETDLQEIIPFLHEHKIFVRPIWTPLHKLPMYENCPRANLSTTENLHKKILCLPSSPFLAENLL